MTALLVKALEKAPEQRFHSAAAFRDAVSRCLDQYVSDMGLAAGARGDLDQEPAAPATAQKVRIANQAFVCPQPVVLVGTHVNGVPNYTTISWASRVSYSPALMAITVGKKHHSNMGIRQTGEFTVNTPSVDLIQQVDFCGIFSGETTDKSTRFTPFYGFLKNAPMIKECALSLECKVVDIISLYGYDMFIGEIVGVYSEERYLTDDKPDMAKMRPLALSTPDTKYWSMGQPIGAAWKIGRDLK